MRELQALCLAGVLALLACSSHDATDAVSPQDHAARMAVSPFAGSDEILSLDEELLLLADSLPGFGGLWVDSAVVVYVVDTVVLPDSAALVSRIRSLLTKSRGELKRAQDLPITLRQARYTFKGLHSWRQAFDNSGTNPGIVFTDTDEKNNLVTIGVLDETSVDGVRSRLSRLGVPEDAFRVLVVPWPAPTTTLLDVVSPTAGGVLVSVSWSEPGVGRTKGGTLTGNVVWLPGDPTQHFFLTCAHCTAKAFKTDPPATWYQADVFDPLMLGAMEVADPPFFSGGSCPSGKVCRWSEAAIVKYGNAFSNWLPQVAWAPNQYTLEILKYYSVNQSLTIGNSWYYKTGSKTGSSSGNVSQTCVTYTPNYAGYMAKGDTLPANAVLLCQTWATYPSLSGDSGAPVFQIPNSPPSPTAISMRGVHHAGGAGVQSVYSPLSGINKDLGTVRWDLY